MASRLESRRDATTGAPFANEKFPARELIRRFAGAMELEKDNRLDDAARIYEGLVAEDPTFARAWNRLGLVEVRRRNPAAAEADVRNAIELEPNNLVFRTSLGRVLGLNGKMDEAVAELQGVLDLAPDYADAYYQLSVVLRIQDDDSLLRMALELLDREDISDTERYVLHYAAGSFHNDLGNFDEAFIHFGRANEIKRSCYEESDLFSQKDRAERCEGLIRTFSADFVRKRFGHGNRSEVPVFVVGMPRSGTSLVEQILASHPKVYGAGEQPDIGVIALQLYKYSSDQSQYPDCIPKINSEIFQGFADAYLRRMRSLGPKAHRIVEKTPSNFENLGLIALMFPKARIIHCRRGPIDTCISCFFQNFGDKGMNFSDDLNDLGFYYRIYRQLMDHWTSVLPLMIHEVHYEELVAHQERVTRELLDFCGLEWDPACASFHRTERAVQTCSVWQVRQPIYKTSIERWRQYERHLGPLLKALGPYAQESQRQAPDDPPSS